jgi:hypothetical protein
VKQLNYISNCIYVKRTRKAGRGVFTRIALAADTIIEKAPVIVMPGEDRKFLDKTLLHDYIFEWGYHSEQCCMALGYVPLYNHSYQSNCEYEMDFTRQLITVKTVHSIKAGEELFINYNGDWDNKKKVWFEVKS